MASSDEGGFTGVTSEEVAELVRALEQKVLVVTRDSINHLAKRGVVTDELAAECCRPDAGMCCPNAKPPKFQ